MASDVVTLVRRARDGDVDAFASLVSFHDREIRSMAARLIRDPQDAEDIRQDVWLRVAERIGTLKDAASFGAWIRAITRNVSLNFLREHSWRLHSTDTREQDQDDVATLPDDITIGPEHHVLAQDDQCEVWEALGTLSAQDRLVLRLREIEELSYAEMAKTLNTSAHAAEMRTSRARERLRHEIENVASASDTSHVSRFDLTRLMDDDAARATAFTVHDHVADCARCAHQLATMRVGRDVFTGFAGVMLVPRTLADLASRLRGLFRGELVSARVPVPQLVNDTVGGPVSALMSAGGAAAAATVFAVTAAFGGVPTDAHELPDAVASDAATVDNDRAEVVAALPRGAKVLEDEAGDADDVADTSAAAPPLVVTDPAEPLAADAPPAEAPAAPAPVTPTSPVVTAPPAPVASPTASARGKGQPQGNVTSAPLPPKPAAAQASASATVHVAAMRPQAVTASANATTPNLPQEAEARGGDASKTDGDQSQRAHEASHVTALSLPGPRTPSHR